MNAGYIQFDNQFTKELRVIWGVRVEDFDQFNWECKAIRSASCGFKGQGFLTGREYYIQNQMKKQISG
jgi:hypothetical protein